MSLKRAAIVLAIVVLAPYARADVDACVDGADRAQQLRDQGKLVRAREELIACAGAACPGAVAKQCAKWLHDVEEELPSVSLRVRSSKGTDIADVAVTLDGEARDGGLDGRPIVLDPGPHRFTLKSGDASAEASIVVRAGERNRLVDVTLVVPETSVVVAPPPPPPVAEERSAFRFPWTAGVFIGVAVASFVGTGVLVGVANSDVVTLRSSCAPTCAASDVDSARAKLVAANVTFGVGIASVALATIFLVVANVGHRGKRAAQLTTTLTF